MTAHIGYTMEVCVHSEDACGGQSSELTRKRRLAAEKAGRQKVGGVQVHNMLAGSSPALR